jgi:hypothetical protein
MLDVKDILIKFYADRVTTRPEIDLSVLQNASDLFISTLNQGFGDAIVLSCLTENKKNFYIYSPNKHWSTLVKLNKKLKSSPIEKKLIRTEILEFFNIGNGHLYQRLQRSFGLQVDIVPKGDLTPTKIIKNSPKKIAVCFSTGPSGLDLISQGFKNPRRLDDRAKIELISFLKTSDYEFIELGSERMFDLENVKDLTGLSIEDSINELSSCEYFIGLNSGFMSAAAALSIKSIIFINVPKIQDAYLPVIKDFYNDSTREGQDIQWLFPQNVFLHQHGSNELVPIVTKDNIKRAINGEVYPFWKTDYLDLIF